MLKKEINNIELSANNPYEIKLINIPAGNYRLRIIHQNRDVFERSRSLFFTFNIPGLTPQEIRDLLGLKDISAQNGVFAYTGGGEEKAGFYLQEVELNITQELSSLTLGIKTFLKFVEINIDSFQLSLLSSFNNDYVEVLSNDKSDGIETKDDTDDDNDHTYIDFSEINSVSFASFLITRQNPKKLYLKNIKKGNYSFEVEHQSEELFNNYKNLFFTFEIPGVESLEQTKDLLGLKSISPNNGVFTYAGLGRKQKNNKVINKINLQISNEIKELIVSLNTFLIEEVNITTLFVQKAKALKPEKQEDSTKNKEIFNVSGLIVESDLVDNIFTKDENFHPVLPGKEIVCFANVEYKNTEENNKKALLLISFYDSKKQLLNTPPNKLLWIDKYSSFYKYIPCTRGESVNIYDCTIPKEASFIKIAVAGFNIKAQEKIIIHNLNLIYKEKKILELSQKEFVCPSDLEAEISILGWEENISEDKPIVMGVMDEFTQGCFSVDLNLIQPRTDNWYGLSRKYPPKLVFIESAWKGNWGNWQYRISKYSNKPGNEISELCQYFKSQNIPTIFWNKEDPVHHERFMESASAAEYIFTTDKNMIPSYREKTGNNNIYTLPFAAQPSLHKPASLKNRKVKSCFAGSWYGNRHEERGKAIVWLLDAAKKYGLDIYDRNYDLGHSPFPKNYQENVIGSLPYLSLCEEYSKYRVFLNVNSVINSPTMFSRRVFELMASGTPIVSTYSEGIENMFNNDSVWLVNNQAEAEEAIKTLMTDDKEWRRRSLLGIREVFQHHTYAHRLNYIFEKTKIDDRINVEPKILLILPIDSLNEIHFARKFLKEQLYQNYELVLLTDKSIEFIDDDFRTVINTELSEFIGQSNYDLYGVISPDHYYGENYLIDLTNAYIYEPEACSYTLSASSNIALAFCYSAFISSNGTLFKDKEQFLIDMFADKKVDSDKKSYFIDSDEFITNKYKG